MPRKTLTIFLILISNLMIGQSYFIKLEGLSNSEFNESIKKFKTDSLKITRKEKDYGVNFYGSGTMYFEHSENNIFVNNPINILETDHKTIFNSQIQKVEPDKLNKLLTQFLEYIKTNTKEEFIIWVNDFYRYEIAKKSNWGWDEFKTVVKFYNKNDVIYIVPYRSDARYYSHNENDKKMFLQVKDYYGNIKHWIDISSVESETPQVIKWNEEKIAVFIQNLHKKQIENLEELIKICEIASNYNKLITIEPQ